MPTETSYAQALSEVREALEQAARITTSSHPAYALFIRAENALNTLASMPEKLTQSMLFDRIMALDAYTAPNHPNYKDCVVVPVGIVNDSLALLRRQQEMIDVARDALKANDALFREISYDDELVRQVLERNTRALALLREGKE